MFESRRASKDTPYLSIIQLCEFIVNDLMGISSKVKRKAKIKS